MKIEEEGPEYRTEELDLPEGEDFPWDFLLRTVRHPADWVLRVPEALVGPICWFLDRTATQAATDGFRLHAETRMPMHLAAISVTIDMEFAMAKELASALMGVTEGDDEDPTGPTSA